MNNSEWTPTQLLIDRHTRLAFDWITATAFRLKNSTGPCWLANQQSLPQPQEEDTLEFIVAFAFS